MTPMSIADTLVRNPIVQDVNGVSQNLWRLRQAVRTAKRVRCDQIANDLWGEYVNADTWGWFAKEAPLRLPFDSLWVEWNIDPIAAERQFVGQIQLANAGVLLFDVPVDRIPFTVTTPLPAAARHALVFECFTKSTTGYGLVRVLVAGALLLDEDHRATLPNGQSLLLSMPLGGVRGRTLEVAGEVLRSQAVTFAGPASFAVALMNCRNVALDPVPSPAPRSKKSKPEKIPRLDFHTIKLPSQSRAAGSSHNSADPAERAYHLVRGHFKTYTADAPLLGKAVGTYWWGWQARGAKKNGITVTDYEVAPLKAPAA